jgi:hypothetical protein
MINIHFTNHWYDPDQLFNPTQPDRDECNQTNFANGLPDRNCAHDQDSEASHSCFLTSSHSGWSVNSSRSYCRHVDRQFNES